MSHHKTNTARKPRAPFRPKILIAVEWFSYQTRVGIVNFAKEVGWEVNSYHQLNETLPFDWKPSGILCVVDHNPILTRLIRKAKVPVVDLGRMNRELSLPRVLTDDDKIGSLAAEHFMDLGLKYFAFCRQGASWGEIERHEGYARRLRECGHHCRLIEWTSFVRNSKRPVRRLNAWLIPELRRLPRPVGVLAYNDDVASGILRACEEAGFKVPDEILILGTDNDPLVCDTTRIPLSSVDSNLERVGYEGAALLYRLMHGSRPPGQAILVAPRGVAGRESTNALAIRQPHVAAAIRHIQEHFAAPITASSIARKTGVSRAVLYRNFLEHAPFSIAQLITRHRIGYARQLLSRTSKKISDVAQQCGFSDLASFSRAFKRETGISPASFRKGNTSTGPPASGNIPGGKKTTP